MNKQTEALKLALESLVDNRHYIVANERTEYLEIYDKAIDAVEKALAEQPAQQEPVAWQFFQGGKWHNGMEFNDHRKHTEAAGMPVRDLYPPPPAQRKPWVGLTVDELESGSQIEKAKSGAAIDLSTAFWAGARWAEAKLREKNT